MALQGFCRPEAPLGPYPQNPKPETSVSESPNPMCLQDPRHETQQPVRNDEGSRVSV